MTDDEVKVALARLETSADLSQLDAARAAVLGRKGSLRRAFLALKGEGPGLGQRARRLNEVRDLLLAAFRRRRSALESGLREASLGAEKEDVTLDLPNPAFMQGRRHPLSVVRAEALDVLRGMGFSLVSGPEVETEYHNFDALNFGPDHPARQMHDTFYLDALDPSSGLPYLLRTHTSAVQVRIMRGQGGKPPLRCVAVGPAYRSDSDQTHTPQFHQLEGFCIDTKVHLGHLKWVLEAFLMRFFGLDSLHIRFRPSYFPFTSPSLEVDVQCKRERQCVSIGKGNDWLEILGCGMIHPDVLNFAGLDSRLFRGFAFGMGLDRLSMLKFGLTDLRSMFGSSSGWLQHHGFRLFDS